jgi:hypothetical protein
MHTCTVGWRCGFQHFWICWAATACGEAMYQCQYETAAIIVSSSSSSSSSSDSTLDRSAPRLQGVPVTRAVTMHIEGMRGATCHQRRSNTLVLPPRTDEINRSHVVPLPLRCIGGFVAVEPWYQVAPVCLASYFFGSRKQHCRGSRMWFGAGGYSDLPTRWPFVCKTVGACLDVKSLQQFRRCILRHWSCRAPRRMVVLAQIVE